MRAISEVLAALLAWGSLAVGADAQPEVELTFQDPEIVESSGLVATAGLLLTVNDSGDTGRVFAVDAGGRTVGVTRWAEEPEDVEALAPAGDGEVWVADIGDNRARRDSIRILKVPVGRGDRDVEPAGFDLTYPDGARDAESLLVDPTTARVYVATKEVFGGTLYAAPEDLDPAAPNLLEEVGPVLPIATDGAFFPDGRHFVVRGYQRAVVYGFPSLESEAILDLPPQPQGEGIAVTPELDLLLSTEGQGAEVLRLPLPEDVRAIVAPSLASPSSVVPPQASTSAAPSQRPSTASREGKELPETTEVQRDAMPWFLGGFLALGVLIALMLSLRRR